MAKKTYIIKAVGGDISARIGAALGGGFWKWEEGETKEFTVKSVIRKGSVIASSGIATAPDIMDVTDIKTGKDHRVLVNAVLLKALLENYPEDSYVGKSFAVTPGPCPAGKRYKAMDVRPLELGVEGDDSEPDDDSGEEPTPEPVKEPAKKSKK